MNPPIPIQFPDRSLIRAVIFDYSGVLAYLPDDSAYKQLADRYGVRLRTFRRLLFGGNSFRLALLGEISAEHHWSTTARLLRIPPMDVPEFIEAIWQMDELDEELLALIGCLRKRFKVGLLSNAASDLRQVLAARPGIVGSFDDLVISSEVGLVKPDVRIFELAVQRLGVSPEEVLLVDDLEQNIVGAQRAGLQVLHYRNSQQSLAVLKELLLS